MARSLEGYAAVGLPVATEKGFFCKKSWTTLGTRVESERGAIGIEMDRRRFTMQTGARLAALRVVDKKTMEKWIGVVVPAMTHRRELMSSLHKFYRWLAKKPESRILPIPEEVRGEVFMASLLMRVAESNMRWRLEARVLATDATPEDAGAAEAKISASVAKALYWRPCKRGEK